MLEQGSLAGDQTDGYARRLHDLVHSLGTKSALDQVADGNGADECGETSIFALLLSGALLEDLGWAKGRLRIQNASQSLSQGLAGDTLQLDSHTILDCRWQEQVLRVSQAREGR